MLKDPYEILGVRRNATMEEVEQAYRTLVKKYHPDRYRDNPLRELAEEKLKEIIEAYEYIKQERANQANDEYSGYTSYTSQNPQQAYQGYYNYNTQNTPQRDNQEVLQDAASLCAGCCTGLSAVWCLDALCECAGGDCI
ncbi:J domain-containing protein [Fervidobacterium thailandense]|uniref:J domain-containing protein n=1 Tax=Fervidobacterium thailandense TaxID=1008305 RepID=A0A1E3G1L4_9BACT|nr:DnaJ domain-containing protein [Fervidobacterium thailandense]ODN30135.1 hypothetical protein A4H02_06800 [Fervidobacterium thailandense]